MNVLPVLYANIEETPVYGCDHIQTFFMPTDGAILVQMFMTIPPRPDKDSITSKCIGQFHLTPETAQNLIDSLGVDLAEVAEES